MKTKHTTGQWEAIPSSLNPQHNFTIVSNHTIAVADVYKKPSSIAEVAEANAKLIAAAPNLLETLIDIVRVLEAVGSGDTIVVKAAKEAIEKATK